ncbi:hypothetical protein [Beijerinckia mobilis]|uniref:hypothetical protein n=1 Tax=Beijerinckia mobilis TaxID=231434 RepID=UPI0005555B78|nr:hypothetical protein [Beijerinckia mobilis]
MATTAVEAIDHFINARGFREGETFSFASLQIRHPHHDELRAVLKQMGEDGVIEDASEGVYKMTMAGYAKYFGAPPSEDDTINAIMTEIGTRGIKAGKSFIWAPVQESLTLKRFREGDLKPALEKIFANRWLEKASMPGFYRLTDAGFTALNTGNAG